MSKAPLFALLILAATAAMAQDQCTNAVAIIAGVTYTVDTVDGELPQPECFPETTPVPTNGEWYVYTPAEDLQLTITTDLAQNTGRDTRFHVYTGPCGALACVGGDDDSGTDFLSIGVIAVEEGTTYYIAFDDKWEPLGFDFRLIENAVVDVPIAFTSSPITVSGSVYALVDMNNDQRDDVVAISTSNININFQQTDGSMSAQNFPTTPADFTASWSLTAGDLDNNGFNDLMYGGNGGVTFMMANADGTGYTENSFPQYVFCQRGNMVDINADGALDAFMCHDVDPNVYYMNDGVGNLTFNQGGLGDVADGGNYGSIWIDYDNDHDIDLFIAKCRGGQVPAAVDELHRNNGDGTFTNVAGAMGLVDYHQSWSGAWGDYDNDGDMDVMIGASSLSQGGHKFMRNDGTTFTNITTGSGWDVFTGTSIEHAAHDFNNDGWIDVMTAQNRIMRNNGDMTFTPVQVGPQSGAVGDANGDGFLDVQNNNIRWLNNGNDNHWIRINPVGTVSNLNGIGARVEVVTALGTQIRDVKSGDGFRYMSSLMAHFGLGADDVIESITVYWPSGIVNTLENPAVDQVLTIVEDMSTSIAAPRKPIDLVLYPVPATDMLYLMAPGSMNGRQVEVVDIAGRTVISATLVQGSLDISALPTGVYSLRCAVGSEPVVRSFVKQ